MKLLRGLQTKFLNKKYLLSCKSGYERIWDVLQQQQGHNLGMYASVHRGNFQIMRAGIKRKSNVRTRKGTETCVCLRRCVCVKEERAETREIKSLEIRSEIEWSITELLSHRKTDRTDTGDAELYLQRSDSSHDNERPSFVWLVRGSGLWLSVSGLCEWAPLRGWYVDTNWIVGIYRVLPGSGVIIIPPEHPALI